LLVLQRTHGRAIDGGCHLPPGPFHRTTLVRCASWQAVVNQDGVERLRIGMDDARDEGRPCSEPEHRQFDFWLGEWEVRDPEGTLVGHNRISRLFDGCGLLEEWRGVSGLRGTSLNVYAAGRGHWHQTWVDAGGTLLLLDGGLRDGAMVLEGTTPGPRHHRISWSLVDGDPDRVRQLWETSPDGQAWSVLFDGRYKRSAAPVGAST
jgi:hypothetical protein